MDKTLIESALRAADSLLGVAIHSGAHLQTAEGRNDAKEIRKLVQDAIASLREDHAQAQ